MVDVQSETVERYIKDGKVKPDLSIPFGDKRMFHYFRGESIRNIAKQYGWDLITPQNMADKFMKFIETMDMSFSYKPVLLKAIYEQITTWGRKDLKDVDDSNLGLAGSPTQIAKASDKVRKGKGVMMTAETAEEGVEYIMDKLLTKHVI